MPNKSRRYKESIPWNGSIIRNYQQPTVTPPDPIGVQPGARPELHTKEGGVWTPLLQTLPTGIFLGIAAGTIAWLAHSAVAWRWGVGICAITWAIAWLLLLYHTIGLSDIRPWFGMGGEDDDPHPNPQVDVTVHEKDVDGNTRTIKTFTLPASEEQLRTLAFGVMAGIPFSEANWTPMAKGFSGPQFRNLRGEMLKRGLLVERTPGVPDQGYDLNAAGRAIMRHYCPVPQQKGK